MHGHAFSDAIQIRECIVGSLGRLGEACVNHQAHILSFIPEFFKPAVGKVINQREQLGTGTAENHVETTH